MISPKIARELRDKSFDVQAIKSDRPDLETVADLEIVQRIRAEQRGIVTSNVADFQPIHQRLLASQEEHYGILFTWDASLPRNKANVPLWVKTLKGVLKA